MATQLRHKRRAFRRGERGSALLVSLMIIVGLSLLGLGFVAVSETESAISINQRNAVQTQAVAEAGARTVVEWFQEPTWARARDIMPANDTAHDAIKTLRKVGTYSGYYKPRSTGAVLFDKPFRPNASDRLFGTEESADIIINSTTEPAAEGTNNHLARLNTALFGPSIVSGETCKITEIKVYAPPVVGGTLADDGTGKKFWVGGTRYGVATIMVTAQKTDPSGANVLASRSVRLVIGELPVPVPGGPIQSDTSLSLGGTFDVHWGNETSSTTLDDSQLPTSLPWANAYERPHFERGYDAVVWPFPIIGSAYDNGDYFQELLGKSYDDPWFGTRARSTNTTCPNGVVTQCGSYGITANDSAVIYSSFQLQTVNNYPTQRNLQFPVIKYDFWKRIAKQGKGTKGIYYFEYDAATTNFKRNGIGTARPAAEWVNTIGTTGARLGAGVYFFDTKTRQNPQNVDGTTNTAILTPAVSWNRNDFNQEPWIMSGFIYMNSLKFGTTGGGTSGPPRPYNMPAEIFRDVGFRKWNKTTNNWDVDPVGGGPVFEGTSDGIFSYQDLNNNGRFDLVLNGPVTTTSNDPGAASHANQYVPKTWRPNYAGVACTWPDQLLYNGTNPIASDCSEPHEPYLNFQYPVLGSPEAPTTVAWGAGVGAQREKITGAPCSYTSPANCTSTAYDDIGPLVTIPAALDGVFYNEGSYDSQGNIDYYGAVLIRGAVTGTGTAKVWFDEQLLTGTWAPPGLPRVIVFSEQTDEQQ